MWAKIKWTKLLAAEVASCLYWTRYVDEDWIIEGIALRYPATSRKKPRRVAVIRKAKVIQDVQTCFLLDNDWENEAMGGYLLQLENIMYKTERNNLTNYVFLELTYKKGVAVHYILKGFEGGINQ